MLLSMLIVSTRLLLAATPEQIQAPIDIANSPDKSTESRVEAAKTLSNGWQDSLPALIQNIDAYYRPVGGRPYSDDAVEKLVPLTDLLVTIVVNKEGAVQAFREANTEKTIDLLASAAGGDDRNLRFNASFILAKVVDDNTLCIILHRLRDPEIGENGRTNLLQIAVSAVSNASRENVIAAKETSSKLMNGVEGKSAELVSLLGQIASARQDAANPLPPDSYCARYDVDTGLDSTPPADTSPAGPAP